MAYFITIGISIFAVLAILFVVAELACRLTLFLVGNLEDKEGQG